MKLRHSQKNSTVRATEQWRTMHIHISDPRQWGEEEMIRKHTTAKKRIEDQIAKLEIEQSTLRGQMKRAADAKEVSEGEMEEICQRFDRITRDLDRLTTALRSQDE